MILYVPLVLQFFVLTLETADQKPTQPTSNLRFYVKSGQGNTPLGKEQLGIFSCVMTGIATATFIDRSTSLHYKSRLSPVAAEQSHYQLSVSSDHISIMSILDITSVLLGVYFSDFSSSVVYSDQLLGAARHTLNILLRYPASITYLNPLQSINIGINQFCFCFYSDQMCL